MKKDIRVEQAPGVYEEDTLESRAGEWVRGFIEGLLEEELTSALGVRRSGRVGVLGRPSALVFPLHLSPVHNAAEGSASSGRPGRSRLEQSSDASQRPAPVHPRWRSHTKSRIAEAKVRL